MKQKQKGRRGNKEGQEIGFSNLSARILIALTVIVTLIVIVENGEERYYYTVLSYLLTNAILIDTYMVFVFVCVSVSIVHRHLRLSQSGLSKSSLVMISCYI